MDVKRLRRLIRELSRPEAPAQRLRENVAQPSDSGAVTTLHPVQSLSETVPWNSGGPQATVTESVRTSAVGPAEDATMVAISASHAAMPADSSQLAGEAEAKDDPAGGSESVIRYEKKKLLGRGASGEVWRVYDRTLGRTVAMKIAHPHVVEDDHSLLRFLEEAQVLAQLGHPSILPVFDIGALESGHLYFTMTEIEGESLAERIQEVHQELESLGVRPGDGKWNLFRLVALFADVCNAVAYAHERGVIHRDLKPSNIMVGAFGEVLVVDWGLAKVIVGADAPDELDDDGAMLQTVRSKGGRGETLLGTIAGTPYYMAPEQARGEVSEHDQRTDIYSLGAILYEILRGVPPVDGPNVASVLGRIAVGDVLPFSRPCAEVVDEQDWSETDSSVFVSCGGVPIPEVLAEVAKRALAHRPEGRFQNVSEFLAVIEGWLDGSKKAERGLALVASAAERSPRTEQLENEAKELRTQAKALLKDIPLWANESLKSAGWALEEQANGLMREAVSNRIEVEDLLQAALAHKSDLKQAHVALAEHYQALHRRAEDAGKTEETRVREQQLRATLRELPGDSVERARFARYLRGDGQLAIRAEPSDVELSLFRFVSENCRLVLESFDPGVPLSLRMENLPMGSYVLRLNKAGYEELTYPFDVGRGTTWQSVRPDGVEMPVRLLREGQLEEGDCYVPGGWCRLGGDTQTPNSLPGQSVWVDDFVVRRFPVTHEEYLAFLNDLVSAGDRELALRHVPRQQVGEGEELGTMLYALSEAGQFSLPESDDVLSARQPVTLVTWESARAYTDWLGGTDNKPWRLLTEFEWEKSARGVDGRFYPWGDKFDPSRSCMKDSHSAQVQMQEVESFPIDVSVYGVRGTAGNTRDWCLDRFREEGPPLEDGRLLLPTETDLADTGFKSTRGGSYGNSAARARSADRDWWFPDRAYIGRGFRVGWSVQDSSGFVSTSDEGRPGDLGRS